MAIILVHICFGSAFCTFSLMATAQFTILGCWFVFAHNFHFIRSFPLCPSGHQSWRILIDAIAHIRHTQSICFSFHEICAWFRCTSASASETTEKMRGKSRWKFYANWTVWIHGCYIRGVKAWRPYNLCALVLNYAKRIYGQLCSPSQPSMKMHSNNNYSVIFD